MSQAQENNPAPNPSDGFDRQEVNARVIAGIGLSTVVIIVATIFAVQYYHDITREEQVFVKVLQPVSGDLQNLRAQEDQLLHSYEYIDRDRGTVRLPVERAMELLTKEYEAGKLPYPTTPYPVIGKEEQAAADAQ